MLGFYNYTTWLTYLGALCGVSGIWSVLEGHETLAVLFLAAAGFFDLFDGKVASTKKDRTEQMKKFGIQIDSLSDLICFCVLPAALLYQLAKTTFPDVDRLWFCPLAVFYVLAGLIRLAYFNVSEEDRQKKEAGVRRTYTGIPVTTISIAIPLFFGLYRILLLLFAPSSNVRNWELGYFAFYCFELLFFGFGFLFKGFKVAKVHGKKMLVPLIIGAVAVLGVLVAFFLNLK